ncbi:MAG: TIGR03790 family protein [Verrucomicrobiales bacterium]|nr:TIGR03790 family protein [Verrucomicrobiales bacterium]
MISFWLRQCLRSSLWRCAFLPARVPSCGACTTRQPLELLGIVGLCLGLIAVPLHAEEARGRDVVVLYNSSSDASQSVAEHYAEMRDVPSKQVIGLPMPLGEVISRSNFIAKIETPFVEALHKAGLMQTREEIRPATDALPGRVLQVVTRAKVRYLAVCYGVPLRVAEDATRREPESSVLPEALRRNEAAVDAELTVLPLLLAGHARTGPAANVFWGATNTASLNPENGVFVVGRLDGPTPELARKLVDRAVEAEQKGLLGRAYFDIRGVTDPAYVNGDTWISNAWLVATRYGYDTSLDQKPETLPTGFPLSHVALYAGWYDAHVSGPFALPQVEFMPGAIAYHLHSFSAASLHSTNQNWVGPLVARGVTATMGMVAEPYLDGTPEIGLCFARLLFSGFTWGEAALVSQRLLSWQLTVIGDPLYRPFATNAIDRLKDLAARGDGRVDWSLVTLYNRKREVTRDVRSVIAELEKEPRLRFSPVLLEKLGDFWREANEPAKAAESYHKACAWKVSPQQRKRLLWNGGEMAQAAGDPSRAYDFYATLADIHDPLPDPRTLFERLISLSQALSKEAEVGRWTKALEDFDQKAAKK